MCCSLLSPDCRIQNIEAVHKTPIMFFRPNEPSGGGYIQVNLEDAFSSITLLGHCALTIHALLALWL